MGEKRRKVGKKNRFFNPPKKVRITLLATAAAAPRDIVAPFAVLLAAHVCSDHASRIRLCSSTSPPIINKTLQSDLGKD
eukprot:5817297-Amphidinium_carterae.1